MNSIHAKPAPLPAGMWPRVSILIVNYRGAALTRACLESLALLDYPDFEIVVVENGSPDGQQAEALAMLREFPSVKVVVQEHNTGFAGGNNAGLAQARGEMVLLLNNDTVVTPGFLRQLVAHLLDHPEAGAAQGKMLLPKHGGTLDVCGSFLTAFGLPYHFGYFKPDGPRYGQSRPVFSGKGACLLFRRELVERAGGFLFEEGFFCYYEESDFCHRLWLAGAEVHFVASDPIQHFMGGTSDNHPQTGFVLRHYLRNMTFSLLGNLGGWSLLRVGPPFFGVLAASLLLALVQRNRPSIIAHAEALSWPLRKLGQILRRRALVRRIRRRPDAWIFGRAMRTPRLDYFIKTAQGRIGEYADDQV